MSEQGITHDVSWAATFDLLDCLRPVIPADNVHIYFAEMLKRIQAAVGEAVVIIDRERQRLNGGKKGGTQ